MFPALGAGTAGVGGGTPSHACAFVPAPAGGAGRRALQGAAPGGHLQDVRSVLGVLSDAAAAVDAPAGRALQAPVAHDLRQTIAIKTAASCFWSASTVWA